MLAVARALAVIAPRGVRGGMTRGVLHRGQPDPGVQQQPDERVAKLVGMDVQGVAVGVGQPGAAGEFTEGALRGLA